MPLRKVKKTIVDGAVLVAHYGADFGNVNVSSSTYTKWGHTVTLTPQFEDSHLEIVFIGTVYQTNNAPAGGRYGNAKFVVNGQDEYFLRGILGANMNISGEHSHQNQTFGESNGRQNWRYYGTGSSLYMSHIHSPGSINKQEIEVYTSVDSSGFTMACASGYMTIAEISGDGYNRT
jgi:hypothetical protein